MSKGGGQGSYQQMQEFNGGGIYGDGIGAFNRGQFGQPNQGSAGQRLADQQRAQGQLRDLIGSDGRQRGANAITTPAPTRGYVEPGRPVYSNMQDFNRRAMEQIFGQPAQRLADQQRAQQQAVAQGGSGGANAITTSAPTPTSLPEMRLLTDAMARPRPMPFIGGGFDDVGGFMSGGFGGFGGFKPQPMPFVRRNTQFRMPSFGPSYGMINPYQGQFSGYGIPSNIASFEQPNYQPFVPPAANQPSGDPPSMVLPPEGGDGTAPPADGGVAGMPPADDGAVQTVSDTTAPVTDAATTEQAVDPYAPYAIDATPLPPDVPLPPNVRQIDRYTPIYQPQPTYVPYRPMPMPTYNPYGSGQFMQDYGGIGGFGRYDLGLAGRQYR